MAFPLGKSAILVALFALAVPAFVYRDSTKSLIDSAHEWVSQLGIYAYPIWVILHALFIVICFPGTFAFEGAAGLLFGVVKGSAAVLAAKTLGAAIAFWLGKTLLRDQVRAYVQSYPKFNVVIHGVRRDGWWFVLLARLSPIPSWINNYGLAAVDVNFFPDYILASCAGTVPFILLNTYAGYLAEQGLSATEIDRKHVWTRYALPVVGFSAAVLLFWKLTSYAKHYQDTLETSPSGTDAADTASQVVFLSKDKGLGPAGGLRSRTRSGEKVMFSPDLGLVASPLPKKGEETGEEEHEKKVVEVQVNEEEGEVQLKKIVATIEPSVEDTVVSPRRRGRPRKSTASPAKSRTPAKPAVRSPMTSPSRRRPARPKKFDDYASH